jgi:hypothetical protein
VVFATQNAQPSESEAVKNETRASRRAQRTVDRLRVSGTGHLSSWFKAIRPQTERSTSRSPGRTHDRVTRESTGRPVTVALQRAETAEGCTPPFGVSSRYCV